MIKKIAVLFTLLFGLIGTNANATEIVRTYGVDNAPVKIEEFSSLTCAFCAKLHRDIYPELDKKYIKTGKVQIIYHNFPLDNVAMAAGMLGLSMPKNKYFAYLQYAFANQDELVRQPLPTLYKWGQLGGFDKAKVDAILKNNKLLSAISNDMKAYDNKYKITGTPTMIINGKKYQGKLDKKDVFAQIDKELKK